MPEGGGAGKVLERLNDLLGVDDGGTTDDGKQNDDQCQAERRPMSS